MAFGKHGKRFRLSFLDDSIGNVGRCLFVMVKFHRQSSPSLRHRTQRGGISKHLAQWNHRIDNLARKTIILALQNTTGDDLHHP